VLGSVPVRAGRILFEERDVTGLAPHRKVELGLTLVPEDKHLFREMTVYENLVMGAYRRAARAARAESLDLVFTMFPILAERRNQKAGSLSGGQQQMVTIARALMTRPKLIMMDEPSQGLAPKLVFELFETISRLKREIGLTILLVEQNASISLNAADYVYVMHEGVIKAEGTPEAIKASHEICEAYLGI
jgi:branched-chain amino acid transport system ATP-binding protein